VGGGLAMPSVFGRRSRGEKLRTDDRRLAGGGTYSSVFCASKKGGGTTEGGDRETYCGNRVMGRKT